MDPSNYKVPKRQPINYGPKIMAKKPINKPISEPQKPVKKNIQPDTLQSASVNKPVHHQKIPTTPTTNSYASSSRLSKGHIEPKQRLMYDVPTKSKKPNKQRHLLRKAVKIAAIIILLSLLVIGGYFGYKMYQESNKQPEALNNSSNNTNPATTNASSVSNNPILDADFIVYGTKDGSLFVTDKSDYKQDANAAVIKVVAKSSYPNDKREITISQQKVAVNFSANPDGLKKMADSIGSNTPINTSSGMSYIITGNATGMVAIGATLVSIRTSESLALSEWQQIFDDLQPIQI